MPPPAVRKQCAHSLLHKYTCFSRKKQLFCLVIVRQIGYSYVGGNANKHDLLQRSFYMSLLTVEKVTHGFGARQILEDASFRLLKGEHIGLIGANGEGKSTFPVSETHLDVYKRQDKY